MTKYKADNDRAAFFATEAGLTLECAEWIHEKEIACVAVDNFAVDCLPYPEDGVVLPFHMVAIRDMGLTLGEIFDYDELAADCGDDGVYEFLFCAPALPVTRAVGSPINPLGVK